MAVGSGPRAPTPARLTMATLRRVRPWSASASSKSGGLRAIRIQGHRWPRNCRLSCVSVVPEPERLRMVYSDSGISVFGECTMLRFHLRQACRRGPREAHRPDRRASRAVGSSSRSRGVCQGRGSCRQPRATKQIPSGACPRKAHDGRRLRDAPSQQANDHPY